LNLFIYFYYQTKKQQHQKMETMTMTTTTTTTFAQLPQWLHGEIYRNVVNEDKNGDCIIPKQIKTDIEIKCLDDILQVIDTCAYMCVDKLPNELYEYAFHNPPIIDEMEEFESDKTHKYQYFIKTPEYQAIKLCADNQFATYYTLCNDATRVGNIPLLRFCTEDQGVKNYQYVYNAVANNQIEVLKYLLVKFPEWTDEIKRHGYYCGIAAKYGHLEMLKYLRKLGAPWSDASIHIVLLHIMSTKELSDKDNIENNKRFACLEYMIRNGCKINEYEINCLYNNGKNDKIHDKIVMFLVEVGGVNLDFNIVLMDYYAKKGNIVMMEYLLNRGAPFTAYTAYLAKIYNHKECFEFCINHGAPIQFLEDHIYWNHSVFS